MPLPPPTALLCERCGYVLDGLPETGACPECGLAISQSVPERRVGTPWQQRANVANWWRTNWLVLTKPRETFGVMRVDADSSVGMLISNLMVCATLCPCIELVLIQARQWPRGLSWDVLAHIPFVLFIALVIVVIVVVMTWIESRGVRFFGRQRQWRVTRDVAWAVCEHASIGWLIAGVLAMVGTSVGEQLGGGRWLDVIFPPARSTDRGPLVSPNALKEIKAAMMWIVPLCGWLIGLLTFETLVYLGVRRCKFANAPRPPKEPGAPTTP